MNPLSTLRDLFLPRKPQGMIRISGRSIEFLDNSRMVGVLIFFLTVTSIVMISYEGVNSAELPAFPGQIATVTVHADEPFSYVSKEQTREARERLRNRLPPVYRLEFAPFNQFERHINELLVALQKYDAAFPANAPSLANRRQALAEIVDDFNRKGPYRASLEDVQTLHDYGDAAARSDLVNRCLDVLHEIYSEGVHDQSLSADNSEPGSVTIFQIMRPGGEIVQRPVQSIEEALIYLRVNLTAEGMPRQLSLSLFRLFSNGLTPNLVFDQASSEKREAEAVRQLKPITVNVERGETIVKAGTRITPEQYEMLQAHRDFLHQQGDAMLDQGLQLFGRVLMVLAMVAACVIYIRIEDPDTLRSNGRLALLALVVIVNLALVRLTYSLLTADFFIHNPTWAATLPFLAPTGMAPLIVAILIDAGSGIFMALFISLFTGVIYGNRFDVQVITFLASMVAIAGCHSVRRRSSVVKASVAGGLVVSCTTLVLGLVQQTPMAILVREMSAGLATGIITGVAVVGLLPVLEALFRRTTDITLLELTDYNHPLLRLMQLETPGTYHHSLVVAQLSENAAAAIGANPLLARVCALFHDIGKTRNPGFFSENQNETANPHDSTVPEESARIIKRHVSDGIELARKHHLPKAVLEVIQQHHGTTLIRFFYSKACLARREGASGVDESAYRYDGPTPSFKESAIIALADTVEATVRSLKQFTPEELEKLIDKLVQDRIEANQLDRAPITLAELAKVKESFSFTLLNMLHSRVEYPK
ncbi:ribonuclease Y [mine drainage metagenome]|uniref:Ribonuclease Y n=1 Tax=mine drainage metagenome TaxID=410659 RepID=A0A1J5SPQ5_9ZZZZ